MARITGAILNRGNPNFSNLLGSFDGVRGLEDATYHTWAHALLNAELRQAVRLASRWALQGVVFADLAAFDRIEARGRRSGSGWAASGGLGVRVLPTFLAEVVLRLDFGRSLEPEQGFFVQWGLSQYF